MKRPDQILYPNYTNKHHNYTERTASGKKLYLNRLVLVLMALKRLSEGRGSNRQLAGTRARWVTYHFASSTTQPSTVEGGLPNFMFQLIYITGRSAPKPDTDTKLKTLSITEQ